MNLVESKIMNFMCIVNYCSFTLVNTRGLYFFYFGDVVFR